MGIVPLNVSTRSFNLAATGFSGRFFSTQLLTFEKLTACFSIAGASI